MDKQKIALVTGAAGNLGKAVTEKFLKEGYKVVGTCHNAASLAHWEDNAGLKLLTVDLADESQAAGLAAGLVSEYGKIDVAVFTVGGFAMGDIAATSKTDLYQQYQLNFETAYNVARPIFSQMMRQNSGHLFFIGSQAGLDAAKGKGVTAYSLSKSLLFHLAQLMNVEAEGKSVFTKVIVPGIIDTPQNREAMPNGDFGSWETPDQIASVIYKGTLGLQ